jgi:hypothetical protein
MTLNDPEVYRPFGVAVLAFIGSFSLESMETVNEGLMIVGRFATGIAMIVSSGITIYKVINKLQKNEHEKRKN